MTDAEWEDPTNIRIVFDDQRLAEMRANANQIKKNEAERERLLTERDRQISAARSTGLSWSKINEASRQKNAQVGFDRRQGKS
jgi:hypothetical protein